MLELTRRELLARAARLSLVLADNDGTLTDGCVYYSERGEELKRYSLRDGHGVELLREQGVESGIVTRERSEIALRRAEKLRMRHVFVGVADKAAFLPELLERTGRAIEQLAFIGDDVNDLGIIQAVAGQGGLTAAPADAAAPLLDHVHFCAARPGGAGALRDFADWLLELRRGAAGG